MTELKNEAPIFQLRMQKDETGRESDNEVLNLHFVSKFHEMKALIIIFTACLSHQSFSGQE